MYRRAAIFALAAAGWLIVFTAGAAMGDDFKLIPSASIQEEFNDNIFFTSAAPRSSFITTMAAGVALLENTERLTTKLDVRLDGLLYSADTALDGLEQRYRGQLGYLVTPLVKIGGSAQFSRESRPDRYIETAGLVVRQDSSHQQYSANCDATMSEKSTGLVTYLYDWADYHDPTVSNFHGHSARGLLVRDLGETAPLLKLRTLAGYSIYRYNGVRVQNASLAVGAGYPIHELWSIQGDIGGRFTHADFSAGALSPTPESSDDPDWVAGLTASYRGEKNTATLFFSNDIQNAAGRSGATETRIVSLNLAHRFSYELAGSLTSGYYHNSSNGHKLSSHPIDERTIMFNPSLRYAITRDIAAEISFESALVQDHRAGTEAHRNKLYISLTASKPFFD